MNLRTPIKLLSLTLLLLGLTLQQLAAQSCNISTSVNGIAGTGHANANIGQSFTACKTGKLTSVSAVAGNASSGFNNVYVIIYSGEGYGGTNLGQTGNVHVKANRTTTWGLGSLDIDVVQGQKYTARFVLVSGTPQLKYGTYANTGVDYYPGGRIFGAAQAHNDMFFSAAISYVSATPTPEHQAVDVSRVSDISMLFTRNMTALTGDITLRDVVADESVSFPASQLSIVDKLVTIPNNATLKANTQYEVLVPSTILESTDGFEFGGYGAGEWTFTTTNNTVPFVATTEGAATNVSPIPYTVDFSEVVTGFEMTDLMVTNGAASNFAGSGQAYSFDITPAAEGVVKIAFDETATIEGNEASLDSIEYDVTLPTVMLSSGFSGTISNVPFTIDITFSEEVFEFEMSDLSATNGTILDLDTIDGANYQVTLTAVTEGAISIELAADVATDKAGNGNSVSNEYTVDYEIDLNDGLYSYYPLNNILWDVQDNNGGLTAYPTLPSIASDRFDQADGAYYFSDTTGQLNVAALNIPTIQNGYSVSTWINPNDDFDSGTDGQKYVYNHAGYSSLYFEGGKFKALINNTDLYETNALLSANQWHHLVLIVAEDGDVKLYINGNLFNLGDAPASILHGSGALNLGINDTFSTLLGGSIDEIRFYNKPLNSLEVDALNNAPEYKLESRSEVICNNTSFTTPSGDELTEAGNYSFVDPSQDSDPDTFVAFTLSLIDAPDVTAHIDNSLVCEGNPLLIHGEGALSYVWDNGIQDSVSFVSTTTTTYNVTGTAENGCMNTASVEARVTPRGYADEAISTPDAGTCLDGSTGATISTASSEVGVNYYLRDSNDDNEVLFGPIAGTGNGIDFTTGNLFGVNTYNVYAERDAVLVGGKALDFDGSNDEVTTNYIVPLINSFSFELWLNPRATSHKRVISNYGGGGVNTGHILLDTYDASANNGKSLRLYLGGAGSATHFYSVPNVMTLNEWNHVAVTFDNGAIKIYVNGEEVGSSTAPFTEIGGQSFPMHIGDDTNTGALNFDGQIDDVRFWHTARTEAEINVNMNYELMGAETGLAAYYKFNETTGVVAADEVDGADGTLTNMDEATDWVADAGLIADPSCGFQMTTEVTIGDDEAPMVVTQDVSFQLDLSGTLTITADQVENGSTDNCSSAGSLDFALDQDTFTCNDIGVNQVTLIVTDQVGNKGTATANITITSSIDEYVLTATSTDLCPGESVDFTLDGSQTGVNYSLKNEDGDILAGPIDGTDAALDFTIDAMDASTVVSVHAAVTPVDGQPALDFDGINDVVATTYVASATTALTIEGWIYPRSTGAKRIVTNYSGSGTVAGDIIIDTYDAARNGKGLRFYLGTATGAQVNATVSNVLTLNAWNHIAVTFDSGEITFFVDGIAVGGSTVALAALKPTSVPFHFGEDRTGSGENFNGQMDEFRIWNTVRTEAELLANKNTQLLGTETGLSAYFKFNDDAGTTVTESVNGANGTLLNMDAATDWVVGLELIDPAACRVQMVSTVSIEAEDTEVPTAIAKDISVQLDVNGRAIISTDDVNDGSSDNCTSLEELVLALDVSIFDCDDVGEQSVTLTVTDASDNESSASANVTVTSFIEDESVSVESSFVCSGEEAIVTLESSKIGVEYSLMDGNDQLIEGPIAGTGNALTFNTEIVTTQTVYYVDGATVPDESTAGLDFDGSNDYLDIPINNSFDYENGYSFEGWVKIDLPVSHHYPIFSISKADMSDIEIYIQQSTDRLVVMHNRGLDQQNNLTYNFNSDNEWLHIAVTYDVESNVNVYYDGILQTPVIMNGDGGELTRNTGQTMALGRITNTAFGSNGSYYKGMMDDIRIWTGSRDADQVNDNKDECLMGAESDLEYYFNLNEGSGTVAADLVKGSDATLTNMDQASDWVEGAGQNCVYAVCELRMTDELVINVGDDTKPVVTTEDVTITLDASGEASIEVDDIHVSSSDNCSASEALTLSLDKTMFSCADIGENIVTLSVEDEAENIGTETAIVTVVDQEVPTANIKNITVELTADGTVVVDAASVNDGSSDGCTASEDLTFSLSTTTFTCSNLGENVVTFTVADASGNEGSNQATITVIDATAPTITTNNVTVDLDEDGNAQITTAMIDNESSDNCSFTLALDVMDFSCENLGENTVVLTGTDGSENSSSANAIVTVRDMMPPTVVVRNISVNLDNDGNATVTASDVNEGSSDNCTAVEALILSIDVSSFSTDDLGENNVTLTVEDANGNSATGVAVVTIEQKTAQTIDFNAIADVQYGTAGNIALVASASSNLSVAFSVISGPAILTEDGLSINGAGEVVVEASQAGDDTFAMATARQSFMVTKASLSVTADDLTVVYNEEIPTLTLTYSGFIGKEGPSNLDEEPTVMTLATQGSDAGVYDITLMGGLSSNYELTLVNATLTINKADQTITIEEIAAKDISDAAFEVVASISSDEALAYAILSGPATIAGATVTLTGTTGTVFVEVSQLNNVNYNDATATVSFEVNDASKQNQVITFGELSDRVYGEAAFELNATVDSGLDVEYAIISGPATRSSNQVTITGVGEIIIEASQAGNDSFNPATSVQQSFMVTKAMLTITADDQSMIYDEAVPALTATYSGFVNDENVSVLDAEPSIVLPIIGELNAGTHTILITGGEASNYDFTLVNGTLTVNKATAEITITNLVYEEDGGQKEVTVSTNPSELAFVLTYDGVETAPSIAGTYAVSVVIDDMNYEGTQTATMVIESVALAINDLNEVTVSIYPNPVSETLYIETERTDVSAVKLFNINGSLELESKMSDHSGSIDVTTMANGIYLMMILDEGNNIISKRKILLKK